MKYLKLFEEYDSEETVEDSVIKYVVKFELDDYNYEPIEKEIFDNLEDAQIYFDTTYEYIEGKHKTNTHVKSLQKVSYIVSYTYDTDYETKEDIDEEDKDWEIIDVDYIDNKKYKINEKSDDLLGDIEEWFRNEYNSRSYKYHNIVVYYDDEKENSEQKTIQIRFSDHTENINNIDRYGSADHYISVVISNHDVTKNKYWANGFERRKTEHELMYNSDNNINNIKEDINNLINQIKEQ